MLEKHTELTGTRRFWGVSEEGEEVNDMFPTESNKDLLCLWQCFSVYYLLSCNHTAFCILPSSICFCNSSLNVIKLSLIVSQNIFFSSWRKSPQSTVFSSSHIESPSWKHQHTAVTLHSFIVLQVCGLYIFISFLLHLKVKFKMTFTDINLVLLFFYFHF